MSSLMQIEGLRKIQRNPYKIWRISFRILDKILCNGTRFCMNFWNLHQFWKRSYSIIDKIIWNPTGSYSILENPIRSYRILWDGYGVWEPLTLRTELWKILNSGIIQYHTGSQTKSYKIYINFIQDTMGS